ncbi:MAG: ABC transporter ATP-binding protein [Proteobacteria bacterium]|nr:ABC transporter ATP-binding protein [Pseudomonadota bacterium]
MDIRLLNISKSYEEGGKRHSILHRLNVCFPAGQFTVVLGKSGTGKSTLLNLVGGIDMPDDGTVQIGDTLLNRLSDKERTLFRRRRIGFIFQFFNLIPTLTVLENVTLIRELEGKVSRDHRKAAESILEDVGLHGRLDSRPDRLSGGEQQRVAIARALAHDPDIILADEPTGNLDDETGSSVLKLMLNLIAEKGKTLVMATHSQDALSRAEHVFSIKDKKLVPVALQTD